MISTHRVWAKRVCTPFHLPVCQVGDADPPGFLLRRAGTGAYACTKPVLGFPAASTSEDGFLRAQSSSLTGRGCAATPPQPRNVRLPRQVRPRGRSVMGARRVLKRDKPGCCPAGDFPFLLFAASRARRGEESPRGAGLPRPLGEVALSTGTKRPADPSAAAHGVLGTPITSRPGPSAPPQSRVRTEGV